MKIEKGTDEYKRHIEEVKKAIKTMSEFCNDITCHNCPFSYKTSIASYCMFEDEAICPSMWEDRYMGRLIENGLD